MFENSCIVTRSNTWIFKHYFNFHIFGILSLTCFYSLWKVSIWQNLQDDTTFINFPSGKNHFHWLCRSYMRVSLPIRETLSMLKHCFEHKMWLHIVSDLNLRFLYRNCFVDFCQISSCYRYEYQSLNIFRLCLLNPVFWCLRSD